MNEAPIAFALSEPPALPLPALRRWQPLRLGLVDLYHYDSEEFWFRDGHLLLRGNNGTGKSKVLSLTLPFLFDAHVKPSRIEPDGDNSKKMAWNLLLTGYERRIGYAWIEFGRIGEDGIPRYLSLGGGLSAAAARPGVDTWFFILEDSPSAPRINRDIWLTSSQRVVLTKERLRDAVQGHGQVFETAQAYRRAVDERLFHLGPARYDALMDTLIQLRQPQLSKKPDEAALSTALTEALPPLATDLLTDVAEALGQLEEDRRQLEEHQTLANAILRFNERYRAYAGTLSRRQTRILRQAQTEFDNASRQRAEAQVKLNEAQAEEERCQNAHRDAELALKREHARLDILRSGPEMEDANRLDAAERDAQARQKNLERASEVTDEAVSRLARSVEDTQTMSERVIAVTQKMDGERRETAVYADRAGIAGLHTANLLATVDSSALADLAAKAFESACSGLRAVFTGRREEIVHMRRRLREVSSIEAIHDHLERARNDKRDAFETAIKLREQADADVEQEGQSHIQAWEDHFADIKQLAINSDGTMTAISALSDWVIALDGVNPARQLLQRAQQETSLRLARQGVALEGRRQSLDEERQALEDERRHLEAGTDRTPPVPYTRASNARHARDGMPFWQAVDFRDAVTDEQRSGLEAALEAAGLLDAWLSPDGRLQTGEERVPLHDTQLLARPRDFLSLANWLRADVPAGGSVPAGVVEQILSSIACADEDIIDSEAWIAPDGRFRLGTLSGAWAKPTAAFIGFEARKAARMRRLNEVARRLEQLAAELVEVQMLAAQLERDRNQAEREWQAVPAEEALRSAHIAAAARSREAQVAREKLAEAELQFRESERRLDAARQQLVAEATDLRLLPSGSALDQVETSLNSYYEAQLHLIQTIRELRLALPELLNRRSRETEARNDLEKHSEQRELARNEAEEASARLQVLRESIGSQVEELRHRMAEARVAITEGEERLKTLDGDLRKRGEARAVADERARAASAALQARSENRAQTVAELQRFVASGLLLAAWPAAELPDMSSPWTIDPALTLARRAEQALSNHKDDDEAWARVQRQLAEELNELQRSLSALNHRAQAEPSDWGLIVHIIHQNRPEPPDRLMARLADEIAQRSELLTAKEREVLENHLQAEIATEVQRLMQAADSRTDTINKELHKRPTSTGVRYRLLWEPIAEDEGAPVGLAAARRRLLNTSADLWSNEDREVLGDMLRKRIAAERERADATLGKDGGGSLLDQLARALDYRRWHRFRVERWQDGAWRKLSGPASSGERALGLTVPLFAAIASFYGQGGSENAPRLMLLDEAFAGIDDAARAHCMGLIREFDLDFVITSEREWACYAELPGVAICHLQRREGVDAVLVSRWTWDGRKKTREADPDRRFAPA